ncbi:ABC transporter transmembrane domain-containing protein [Micromonospora sp. LOL_024]|uniref:ABC transporter transmembrane domain-containing protein n=1 Tax=Micromonospora sp. LOL_024 TaxID=3345412 RepID=UPI003A8C7DAB
MREYPLFDPGVSDHRSARRYLLWLVGVVRIPITVGVVYGIGFMLAGSLTPQVVGKAIDEGLIARDRTALLWWGGTLFGLVVFGAITAVLQERADFVTQSAGSFHTMTLVNRQAAWLGATLRSRVNTGEVVSIGVGDLTAIGAGLRSTSRGAGAVVAIVTVATIMVTSAWQLGLTVLVGVPLIFWATAAALGPLRRRQAELRRQQEELASQAVDIAGGLRVLRGFGGENRFAERYREQSQRTRLVAIQVARVGALLAALKALLPGLLAVAVVWLGARLVLAGSLRAGQLVAFYGYAVFLATPLRWFTDTAEMLTRAQVSAGRACGFLTVRRTVEEPAAGPAGASWDGDLVDPTSGLECRQGVFTAVACASSADTLAIADRLGRYRPGAVTLGGTPLADLPLPEVRRHILVVANDDHLFAGRLRTELDPGEQHPDEHLTDLAATASAHDVIEPLPDGLDTEVQAGGRNFSGGERQRLRLLRALAVDPDVLILVDPTSAVDAHTEDRIAGRLRDRRHGRTTVVFTTSPIVLGEADTVVHIESSVVVAAGSHGELLTGESYRALVTRGVDL